MTRFGMRSSSGSSDGPAVALMQMPDMRSWILLLEVHAIKLAQDPAALQQGGSMAHVGNHVHVMTHHARYKSSR